MPTLNPLGAREPVATHQPQSQKTISPVQNRKPLFQDSIKSQNSSGSSFLDGVKSAFTSLWHCIVSFFTCSCFGKSKPAKPESVTDNQRHQDTSLRRNPNRDQRPHFRSTNDGKPSNTARNQGQFNNLEAHCKRLERMADTLPEIRFYDMDYNRDTAFMSNFYSSPITVDGFTFQTGEAYFHALKHWDKKAIVKEFANTRNAEQALAVNKKYKLTPAQVADWENITGPRRTPGKVLAMDTVLKAKFQQNPHLLKLLLATKNCKLSEHNPGKGRDSFWSTGPNGRGEDRLGNLMMGIRTWFQLPE